MAGASSRVTGSNRVLTRLLLLAVLALVPAAAFADEPVAYYIPPPQFNAQMEVMDLGFANVFALFQNATGSFNFDESAKAISRLRIAIDAGSLMAGNSGSQQDLARLIGAGQFAEIRITDPDTVTFTDNKAELKASLTLHGVTKPVTLQATLNHIGSSPYGGGMWAKSGAAVGLSLTGAVNRTDFGMAGDPAANEPARFGDMLTFRLEMQGIRQ